MKFLSYAFSNSGPRRENQDALFMKEVSPTCYVAAIADGIGGQPGGKFASTMAIEQLKIYLKNHSEIEISKIYKYIHEIFKLASSQTSEYENMGTTLTMCLFMNSSAFVGHVGDTRLYHISQGLLFERTHDQTEVQKLVDEKILSEARAKTYRRRNVLLSALTAQTEYNLFQTEFDIHQGDRFIFLSDGVHEIVSKDEILSLSKLNLSIEELTIQLKKLCEHKGPKDNYSAICIEVV